MKKAMFDELMSSANEALEHARGERELRDSLGPAASMPLTPELAEELDRRDAEVDADPDEGVPWETVIQELRDELR